MMVEGRSEQLSQITFLIPWALKNMFWFFFFFLMFNLINRLRISVCRSYISHSIFFTLWSTLINHPCRPLDEKQWKTLVSLFAVFQGLMGNSATLCQRRIFHINVCKAKTVSYAVALYHIKQESPSKSLSMMGINQSEKNGTYWI